MSGKKASAIEIEVHRRSPRRRTVARRLELDKQHEEQGMNAKSTEVTEGLVATTREILPTQVGIGSTLAGTMAKVLVEEDIVQTVARAAAERALGPERGLVASPPSSAALRNEAVECPTPSGLHFKWHSCAVRDIPVGAVMYLASPASKRPEVCCLQSILGVRDDLANQR